MSEALTSKERPVFVPAVRTPKLPYLCAGAECVTCKRPVSGDWGLVPDECDTCDAERRARYYRECAQWADDEIGRLTREVVMWSQVWDNVRIDNPDLREDNKPLAVAATYALLTAEVLEQARLLGMSAERELRLTARNAELEQLLDDARAVMERQITRRNELVKALEQLKADAESTVDLYNRNGPQWTSRETGNEYYDASYVVDSANDRIAAIGAALKGDAT